jgi:CheY-like chemotaxis protein/predicted regulator of Ras-like GTPase activity (Roadblock/LC7/MglB family)
MPKILIVDESEAVRTLVERAMGATEIEVLFAASGTHAVERIEQEMPDLVVCDVYMPDTDGYRICEFVKRHPRLGKIPVLLMADVVDGTVLARAARVRPDGVVRKPFAGDELARRIQDFLGAQALAAPAIASQSAGDGAEEPGDLKTVLGMLAARPGVVLAVLVDRDGFLIEWAGEMTLPAEVVGAVASRLAQSSEEIGGELGQGALRSMTFEYEAALVLLSNVSREAWLAVALRDPAMLGAVRHAVKEALPMLARPDVHAVTGAR